MAIQNDTTDKKLHYLARDTWDAGSDLCAAAKGMKTIANLLGADGCDHDAIIDDEREGLVSALYGLAALVWRTGFTLAAAAEEAGAPQAEVQHG